MKVDAHQHFWHYTAAEYAWIGPRMEMLKRDYLPNDLKPLLDAIGMDGAVVVQARQTPEETRWLLELADQYPLIKGVVGWVDLRSPRLEEQLERFSGHPCFRGVRHVVQDEVDNHFLLRSDVVRGIGQLQRYHLTYDLLLMPKHLPVACELVQRFPEQPFVLNHIAKPPVRSGALSPWREDIRRLAALPNVYCKVSGLTSEADWQAWRQEDFRPYLDVVFEAFGAERLMIGSDWPVCTVAGSYERVMGIALDYIAQLSPAEQAGLLGDNAVRFYGLPERP